MKCLAAFDNSPPRKHITFIPFGRSSSWNSFKTGFSLTTTVNCSLSSILMYFISFGTYQQRISPFFFPFDPKNRYHSELLAIFLPTFKNDNKNVVPELGAPSPPIVIKDNFESLFLFSVQPKFSSLYLLFCHQLLNRIELNVMQIAKYLETFHLNVLLQ